MPIFEYVCEDCKKTAEIIHGSDESPEIKCSTCGKRTKKIFSPAGLVFKGTGFYKTDSRKNSCSSDSCSGGCEGK